MLIHVKPVAHLRDREVLFPTLVKRSRAQRWYSPVSYLILPSPSNLQKSAGTSPARYITTWSLNRALNSATQLAGGTTIPHLVPVAASGNSVVQSGLPRSQWTSVIKGTNKSLHLDFQDWTIFTFLVIAQYLTWPRLPCQKKPLKTWKVYLSHLLWLMIPMILWKDERLTIHQTPVLAYSSIYQRSQWFHATMQIYCIKGKIKNTKISALLISRSNSKMKMNMRNCRPR